MIRWLLTFALKVMQSRPPDFVIGEPANPYLLRWWLLPRNPLFNVYVHEFRRSDDDRALHDHMYVNVSILLHGCYTEHRILAGGIHTRTNRQRGAVIFRLPATAHRIELRNGPCTTLFISGPRVRKWGFHCPNGWVPWQKFTNPNNAGEAGKGCEQ